MSQPGGFNIDARSVLIDMLGRDQDGFRVSCLNFKNSKGIKAIYEKSRLEAELLDFAKDPSIGEDQLGAAKPRQPVLDNLSPEEAAHEEANYKELLKQWEFAQAAIRMQVPVADLFAIKQYMKPYDDAINATPAVKGKRFHAFTKQVEEEQTGFLGMGGAKRAMR